MDTRYIQMEEWNGVQVDYYVYDTGMVCPLLYYYYSLVIVLYCIRYGIYPHIQPNKIFIPVFDLI